MKKNISRLTAVALSAAMLLTACGGGGTAATTAAAKQDAPAATTAAAAAPSGDAAKLTMGTGGTTGTYYAFGGVIANVINGKDVGININVQYTGASKANIYLVNDGEADLAIVQIDPNSEEGYLGDAVTDVIAIIEPKYTANTSDATAKWVKKDIKREIRKYIEIDQIKTPCTKTYGIQHISTRDKFIL